MNRILGVILLGALWAGACASPGGDGSDSNTNWLSNCVRDADCAGLKCECGMCTRPCAIRADCGSLGGVAECLALPSDDPSCRRAPGAPSGLCTRVCSTPGDCGSGASCIERRCIPSALDLDSGPPAPIRDGAPSDAALARGPDGDGATSDEAGGCFFNIPPGGCRSYPTNAYGGSFLPGDCAFRPWSEGCLDYFSCIIACSRDADCPEGGSGNATPRCDLAGRTPDGGSPAGECRLDCGAGTVCPLGMACVTNPHDGRRGCYWATDIDCPACPVFPSCMP